MKKNLICIGTTFLWMMSTQNCTESKNQPDLSTPRNTSLVTHDKNQDSSLDSNTDDESRLQNPSRATAKITKISTEESHVVRNVNVPKIDIDLEDSDYVEILRCAASYNFVDNMGQDVFELDDSKGSLRSKKESWTTALNDYLYCKIINNKISSESAQDMSCPTGRFYYIINPCIEKINSTTGQDDCSYNISKSETIEYQEAIRQQLRDQAIELSKVEQKLYEKTNDAAVLATLLNIKLKACEDQIATESALKSFYAGTAHFAAFALLFVTVGVTSGPVYAVMAGQMGGMFFMMHAIPALDLLPIMNTCTGGANSLDEIPGVTKKAQKRAKRYEKMYGVYEIMQELDRILVDTDNNYDEMGQNPPDGGEIALIRDEMTTMLSKMAGLDSRVRTFNQAFEDQGVDQDNPVPEDFQNALQGPQ